MAKAFSLYFDGSKALIGREEFQVDEALKEELAELPRTGKKWFRTTIMKDVELRYSLKPKNTSVVWKKSIPST